MAKGIQGYGANQVKWAIILTITKIQYDVHIFQDKRIIDLIFCLILYQQSQNYPGLLFSQLINSSEGRSYFIIQLLMLEQAMIYENQIQRPNSIEIYNFLSKTLQEFNHYFSTAQRIMHLHLKQETYYQDQLTIQLESKLQASNLLKQSQQLKKINIQATSSVYKRLIGRLAQTILTVKHDSFLNNKKASAINKLINRVESGINIFQSSYDLPVLIQNMMGYFGLFAKDIKNINKCEYVNIGTKHELTQRPGTTAQIVRPEDSSSAKSTSEFSSGIRYRKANDDFNIRYKTVSCLDIDQGYYRTSMFWAKKQQQFYEDYMERNRNIKSGILNYSKQFSDYLVKKERRRRERKRLKFRSNPTYHERKPNKSISISGKPNIRAALMDNRLSVKINNWATNRSKDKSPLNKDEEQRIKPDIHQLRKTNYQMKNILLTASKLNIGPIQQQSPNPKRMSKNSIDFSFKRNAWRTNIQQHLKKQQNRSFV